MASKEIELEVTPVGGIRFKRGDKEHNDALRDLLLEIMEPSEVAELENFFTKSEDITVLLGGEIFCG